MVYGTGRVSGVQGQTRRSAPPGWPCMFVQPSVGVNLCVRPARIPMVYGTGRVSGVQGQTRRSAPTGWPCMFVQPSVGANLCVRPARIPMAYGTGRVSGVQGQTRRSAPLRVGPVHVRSTIRRGEPVCSPCPHTHGLWHRAGVWGTRADTQVCPYGLAVHVRSTIRRGEPVCSPCPHTSTGFVK